MAGTGTPTRRGGLSEARLTRDASAASEVVVTVTRAFIECRVVSLDLPGQCGKLGKAGRPETPSRLRSHGFKQLELEVRNFKLA